MKDNDEKIIKINVFIKVTSVKSKIRIVYFQSFYSRKHVKIYNCLNSLIIKFIFIFINRSISFNVALCRN